MRHSAKSAFAVGTHKNLIIQWETFLMFCLHFKLVFVPASSYTCRLYAQFLSRSFKSVNSIRNYISGVKTLHALLGFETDQFSEFSLVLFFRGLARLNPHCVKQANPITLEILIGIYNSLDFSVKSNVVYWCLFLFAFFLVARKSNLVPSSKQDIIDGKMLRKDMLVDHTEFLLVTFNWSKTIQFGERLLMSPLVRFKDQRLCPVKAYRDLIKLGISHPAGALFALPDGNCITYYLFQKKLRDCISHLNLDPSLFSTHSFRRGFATLAFQSNVSPDKIQLLGDWKSDAYKLYLELSWKDKVSILNNMFENM